MYEIPDQLAQLQRWFARTITAPIRASDDQQIPLFSPRKINHIRKHIAPGPQLKSEERIGIYQQQYWWRLLTLLQELFPSLAALFDYGNFNRDIAEPYLLKHPPKDWFMSYIGFDLPKWIEEDYSGEHKSIVLKLAQLDLIYEKLFFSPSFPRIEPADLAQCETQTLFLQPNVYLYKSSTNFPAFRQKLLEHGAGHWQAHPLPSLEKNSTMKYFVLFRENNQTLFEEASPAFFKLLARFQRGAKLEDLIPLLEKCSDLVTSFQQMAARGWLTLFAPVDHLVT